MKVLDLFSGIGGFSLGLDRAGFETVAFCEIEKYPISILKKHWPDVPVFEDVRKLNKEALENVGIKSVDVVCGGFPCQPFSVAGKQEGKNDDRHLWPEMFRIIKETRPSWVIGENVAGFVSMALDDVLFDLESEGYETQSFVIPACAVNASHRRDRVWIVAYAAKQGLQVGRQAGECESGKEEEARAKHGSKRHGESGLYSHAKHNGASALPKSRGKRKAIFNNSKGANQASELEGVCISSNVAHAASGRQPTKGAHGESCDPATRQNGETANALNGCHGRINPPTESPVCSRDNGVSNRVARLKALGNAVVPQIPELIGRAIMDSYK